jgi:protein dithiol oxidoreductase (disulfide-forming)
MSLFHRSVLGLLLGVSVLSAVFEAQAATAGKDYQLINPPQATNAPGKVEVLEFFSYACPHCNHLEPSLEAWEHKMPAGVILKRVPVTFGRNEWVALAKLYYTLEVMGQADKLHGKVFNSIHEGHQNLMSAEAAADWAAKQGLDRNKFTEIFNSFGIQSKVSAGNAKAQSFAIDGVPSLIVDGKFKTSPSIAGGNESALQVMDELISSVSKQR